MTSIITTLYNNIIAIPKLLITLGYPIYEGIKKGTVSEIKTTNIQMNIPTNINDLKSSLQSKIPKIPTKEGIKQNMKQSIKNQVSLKGGKRKTLKKHMRNNRKHRTN